MRFKPGPEQKARLHTTPGTPNWESWSGGGAGGGGGGGRYMHRITADKEAMKKMLIMPLVKPVHLCCWRGALGVIILIGC